MRRKQEETVISHDLLKTRISRLTGHIDGGTLSEITRGLRSGWPYDVLRELAVRKQGKLHVSDKTITRQIACLHWKLALSVSRINKFSNVVKSIEVARQCAAAKQYALKENRRASRVEIGHVVVKHACFRRLIIRTRIRVATRRALHKRVNDWCEKKETEARKWLNSRCDCGGDIFETKNFSD
jgi:hypothetical protein